MEVFKGLIVGLIAFTILMLVLGYLPKLISKIYDPINMKCIRKCFLQHGCMDIEIKPFSGHYGVKYTRNGARQYAKCRPNVKEETIDWVGKKPDRLDS